MGGKVKFLYDEHLDNPATTIRVYNTRNNNDLIVKAFYQDDFHMSITNQWATGDSTIFKQIVDSAASLVTGRTGRMATHYAKKGLDWATKGAAKGSETERLGKNIRGFLDKASEYQHASIFSADDFYKTFKGTTVTFPLNLQVTLVSDEKFPTEDIYDKLKKLLNVSIGDYETTAGGFVGIQHAPNGFKSGGFDLADSETLLEGTLRVAYGNPTQGGYVLENMLISNIHCTFSKTKVQITPTTWRPLYIDVQVMLEPGKKFTKDDVSKALGLSRSSFSEQKNFSWKNGKSKKETSEQSIARNKELQLKQKQKTANAIKAKFDEAFAAYPDATFKIDEGVLKVYGKVTQAQLADFQANVSSLNMKEFPEVNSVVPSISIKPV